MTRGLKKREEILKRSSIFEEQPSKSSSFEQPFSAAFLSSFFQQLFSVFFSNLFQQPFSAASISSLSQQCFSAAFSSSLSQQCQPAAFLSSLSQQPFFAAFLSCHPLPSSAIAIILLWAGVGGQLVTSSCCSQGLVGKYAPVL